MADEYLDHLVGYAKEHEKDVTGPDRYDLIMTLRDHSKGRRGGEMGLRDAFNLVNMAIERERIEWIVNNPPIVVGKGKSRKKVMGKFVVKEG